MSTNSSSNANPSGGTSQKVEGTVILNLTQHKATPEQATAGVREPEDKDVVQALLTFEEMPSPGEVFSRAKALAELAIKHGAESAMIGGAPFLMSALEAALRVQGVTPLYAFSRRESADQTQPDGTVRKVAIFRHLGFVEAVHPTLMGWATIEA